MPPLIKIVVPFTTGGSTDVLARSVARDLAPRLGTTVIVENRPGAGSLIGADAVAKAPKDGSVLLFTTASTITAAATTRHVPFDVNADLQPIALLGEGAMVVAVSTQTGFKNPSDLVAAARAKPDALTYASSGVGTIAHLTAELINDAAKIQTRHIPYKGTSQAMTDLATGTVDFTVATYTSLIAQIQGGRVRVIGVTTSQPNPSFPGVLPMASAVPGFNVSTWVAMFAPAGAPPALVQRLNREINEVAKNKVVVDQLASDGMSHQSISPQELASKVRDTYTLWKGVATAKKIVVD
jgi:tripartite-type tricarboxylate transporter receptor subunit TctC